MKKYLDTYFAKEMGHEEIISRQSHDKILTGLSAQLKQATNGDAVKAIEERLRLAEKGKKVQTTPERLHEAAMIKRLKKARDILLEAHAEAQEKGDDELADSIVDLARPYSARYAAQQNKVRYHRAKRKQGSRG